MKYKVCVMTGTRAEYGVLRSLLFKIKEDPDMSLCLAVTGTHLSKNFGNTQDEIIGDGFTFDKLEIPIKSDTKADTANDIGDAIKVFTKYLNDIKPNIVVVLGDRYEALAFTIAAYVLNIPIAHISGGDVTTGALDDGFRHAISKMSTIHFPGCEDSRKRLIQMGENPKNVYNVGEPGVENCLNMGYMTVEELSNNLCFELKEKEYCVVTFHPVTQGDCSPIEQLQELVKALENFPNLKFIITTSNADACGNEMNDIWRSNERLNKNWLVVESLGVRRYLSAVKYSAMVIGNSSSGLIEVPALGVPTINIGNRQDGRMQASSVISCDPIEGAINKAIEIALSESFKEIAKNSDSPFGKGQTSLLIHDTIKDRLQKNDLKLNKEFYDLR